MLKVKIIKGPPSLMGKVFDLKDGENTIGRGDGCDILINSNGVSKRHAKFTVQGDSCAVTDLGSSNGTFVNGLKVDSQILRHGDRVGFHEVIIEVSIQHQTVAIPQNPSVNLNAPGLQPPWGPQTGVNLQSPNPPATPAARHSLNESLVEPEPEGFLKSYLEKVILPGVYSLGHHYPIKNILAGFMIVFVFLVTVLATIPMAQITKEGVQKEAQRRAYMVAKQLANYAERTINAGGEAGLRTDFAEGEEGVTLALIVSKEDGHIIAPVTKANSYSNEEFVARARKKDEVFIQQINDVHLGISIPIRTFSQDQGQQTITSYAVILYKLDSVDLSASVALFARILMIALLLGVAFYYLMYRLVIQPIKEATIQMDLALRGEKDTVLTTFDFDIFKNFLDHVNSAIARMSKASDQAQRANIDRNQEASNLVRIVNDPAFALSNQGLVVQVNAAFEDLVGMRLLTLQGQALSTLQDTALQLNLEDLCQRAKSQPGTVVSSHLEISGLEYEIDVQASLEADGTIGFVFGTLKKRSAA